LVPFEDTLKCASATTGQRILFGLFSKGTRLTTEKEGKEIDSREDIEAVGWKEQVIPGQIQSVTSGGHPPRPRRGESCIPALWEDRNVD